MLELIQLYSRHSVWVCTEGLFGNLRLWSIQELVSSIFNLLDYKSIYVEAVSNNREVLQISL